MALILNIETATKNCSVALAKNGKVISMREVSDQGYSHAEKLHVFIDEVIKESGKKLSELDAIAVSQGPGSYTGLRIGVSAAKGLCYALGKPLIALETLEVLARQAKVEQGLIIPMLDARRMEVYSAVFDTSYKVVRGIEAQIIEEDAFSSYEEPICFLGDGAEKTKTILTKNNFHFLAINFPSAKEMAAMSYAKFINEQFEDVAYFEPYYLKDFVVQRKGG